MYYHVYASSPLLFLPLAFLFQFFDGALLILEFINFVAEVAERAVGQKWHGEESDERNTLKLD
jgi:hypothetical protein